jgi:arylsulfatase A-like enzyme
VKNPTITRRDFIKFLGAAGLASLGFPLLDAVDADHSQGGRSLPNVLILVFDALSAADMSLYGYSRPTTPNFENFAQRSTVFHRHYSAGSFTTPGTASLLTGVLPWAHRAINLQGTTSNRYQAENLFSFLPQEYYDFAYTHNSLAQVLLDQFKPSIETLYEISHLALFSNVWAEKPPLSEFRVPFEAELLSTQNFNSINSSLLLSFLDEVQRRANSQGLLERYRKEFPRGLPNCHLAGRDNTLCFTLEAAIDWITNQFDQASKPFLGYVHLFPPHAPYNPRREFINAFNDQPASVTKPEHHFNQGESPKQLTRMRRKYDEYIAYVDAEFGRLIDLLEREKALESTLLIVTSDHGEIFERGVSGHNTEILYQPLIHIPLLISTPRQSTRIDVHSPTSAIDVVPTILGFLNSSRETQLEGQPLSLDAKAPAFERDLFVVEAKSSPKNGKLNKATFAIISKNYKLIYYRGYAGFDGIYELYDLDLDPQELENLYSPANSVAQELKEKLEKRIAPYI